ncbi:PstS family phosphate ABC transporter substrate-binding protein [Ferrovibrio sp.]|uniref:PstS family phosphate ABC transporter substrate-binding protein n=1 Tax=Ferrovibrio sp. TaxID=1917215 RepID=UPI001B746F94|nr:PstS family phosphate ABC transporter substrate-binding protein [Ferrovibrio sp.]MBP7065615.1 PstS family phosphate ABC transporter substrate-binding protein [Ferrovibrio sp.]
MIKQTLLLAALATTASLGLADQASAQAARDQIRVVGSSTVYPFTTTVAERFSQTGGFKAPIVESTGTGGGMKLFCGGVGTQHPDFTNASRAITKAEFEQCAANGVKEIVEMKVGFDGIAVAMKKGGPKVNLKREHIWLALAAQVPVNGQLVANPYKTWKQIDASLPDWKIEVMGPPPTSGTRDSFVELVMDHGCKAFPEVKAITDKKAQATACAKIREDGAFIEAGENDNLIVQRLASGSTGLLGVFGYSFLEENADKLQGLMVDGVEPDFDTISSGKYPVSRPLFVYAKKAHVGVVPGMKEFIAEYVSDRSMAAGGYLEKKGLVAMPKAELEKVRSQVLSLTNLAM